MLTPLLRSTKKDADKNKDGEIVPKLESVKVVLVHCNLVQNDYQHTSKVWFSLFRRNNLEFWWTQLILYFKASKAPEMEDNVNLKLIIGYTL